MKLKEMFAIQEMPAKYDGAGWRHPELGSHEDYTSMYGDTYHSLGEFAQDYPEAAAAFQNQLGYDFREMRDWKFKGLSDSGKCLATRNGRGNVYQYDPQKGTWEDLPDLPNGYSTLPKMESVFNNHPPAGSKPMDPALWSRLGPTGKSAQQGLDALQKSGHQVDAFMTPNGTIQAFGGAGQTDEQPLQMDVTKGGIWSPATGSGSTGGM